MPVLSRVIDEADARQLPSLIAEWTDGSELKRWIAQALRIDQALLTARPELVVPCLVRRCRWFGDARESLFLAHPRKAPSGAALLRDVIEGWLAESRPGGRWLRSVRPTQLPLDVGAVEGYRTAMPGQLAFSHDGTAIGVIGEREVVAWERVTGRGLAQPRLVAPARPWRLGADTTWGRLVLEAEGRRIEIVHSDDELARVAFQVEADGVIVGFTGMELDDRHGAIDLAAEQLVWMETGACAFAAGHGARWFIGHDHGVVVRMTTTGELIGEWHAPDVGEVAIAEDGTVATRSNSGPPMPCQRLTSTRLVEIGPFGLNLWDTRTGVVHRNRMVTATLRDAACFDPRGLYFALVRADGQLELYGLPVPTLLADRPIGPLASDRALGFSPDGDLLWWKTADGERWAISVADPSSGGRLAPHEPLPEEPDLTATVADGLLVVGELAIPIDDEAAVGTRDGRAFASRTSHYVIDA